MSIGLLLVILLVVILLGGIAPWGANPGPAHFYGGGPYLGGGLGLIVLILVVLLVVGRI